VAYMQFALNNIKFDVMRSDHNLMQN